MSKNKVLRQYVSPIDQFLNQFDKEHAGLSESQKKEIAKFRRIYRLRDDAVRVDKKTELPEGF